MTKTENMRRAAAGGAFALALGLILTPSAAAAPPSVPDPLPSPQLEFEETFENGAGVAASALREYVSADGGTYDADPQWLDVSACNGVIVRADSTFTDGQCVGANDPRGAVRQLADELGGATNHSVTAYTHQGHPAVAGQTLLVQSEGSGITTRANRFYVSSIDLAEMNCVRGAEQSSIQFGLLTPNGEVQMDPNPVSVCAGATSDAPVSASLYSAGFKPVGDELGESEYIARNLTIGGSGNDFAYDNLRFYDATPQLLKSFEVDEVEVGEPVKMIFTVVNTSERSDKTGWSFTDNLPAGMIVSDEPNVETTCAAADVTAEAGATSIAIDAGSIAKGVSNCDISLYVELTRAGDFENVIEGADGLDGQPSATIKATEPFVPAPAFTLTKSANPSPITPTTDVVNYTFVVTNTGNTTLTDVRVTDPGPLGGAGTMSAVTCEDDTLLVDESLECAATYTVAAADRTGAPLVNEATASAAGPDGEQLTATADASVDTVLPVPALSLTKSAAGGPATKAGQVITYSFVVTNKGNVDVTDVTVTEGSFSGKGELGDVVCPADEADVLVVDASVTCTAAYTVVAADLTGGYITNTATAAGESLFGAAASVPAKAEVPTVKSTPVTPQLPATGADTGALVGGGLAAASLVVGGVLALTAARRRALKTLN